MIFKFSGVVALKLAKAQQWLLPGMPWLFSTRLVSKRNTIRQVRRIKEMPDQRKIEN